jgi:hypothetical protein
MSAPTLSALEAVLRTYFHAKDENRPHLLDSVFSPHARLEIVSHADTIALPALSTGREAISDVLVRRFGQTYENVYSFYLRRPPTSAERFSCNWLVAMSEKDARNVRVGCGRYDWQFEGEAPHLAARLLITVEAMQVLPPTALGPVLCWVRQLSYPWSSAQDALESAPGIEALSPVLEHLSRSRSDA